MACLPFLDYGTSFTRRAMSIPTVELHEPDLQHTEMIAFRNPESFCGTNLSYLIQLNWRCVWSILKVHPRSGPFTVKKTYVKFGMTLL